MAPPTAKNINEKGTVPKPAIVNEQPGLKVIDVEKYELGQYGTFDPHASTPARVKKEATRSILLAFLASLLVVTLLGLVGIVGVGVFWY